MKNKRGENRGYNANGTVIHMNWKQIRYIKGNKQIEFSIIPMCDRKDLLIIPDYKRWKEISEIFSFSDRDEIIFLLERINWKREFRIIEMDITPNINSDNVVPEGTLESTVGYKKISSENLFDPDSILNNSQVKEIYYKLEKRFADNATGNVVIYKSLILDGSVLKEISIPILEKNQSIKLTII